MQEQALTSLHCDCCLPSPIPYSSLTMPGVVLPALASLVYKCILKLRVCISLLEEHSLYVISHENVIHLDLLVLDSNKPISLFPTRKGREKKSVPCLVSLNNIFAPRLPLSKWDLDKQHGLGE